MKIFVKVKTKAKENKVEDLGENKYRVAIKELPIKGKANEALVEIVADYFKVSKSEVRICTGLASKNKILEIN